MSTLRRVLDQEAPPAEGDWLLLEDADDVGADCD